MKSAIEKLELKNYYVMNQYDGYYSTSKDLFELWKDNKIVMDNLSEAQVIQLAEIL